MYGQAFHLSYAWGECSPFADACVTVLVRYEYSDVCMTFQRESGALVSSCGIYVCLVLGLACPLARSYLGHAGPLLPLDYFCPLACSLLKCEASCRCILDFCVFHCSTLLYLASLAPRTQFFPWMYCTSVPDRIWHLLSAQFRAVAYRPPPGIITNVASLPESQKKGMPFPLT